LDGDDVAIREFIGLVVGGRFLVLNQLSLVVKSDIGQFLLDVSDDFSLGGGGEGHTQLHDDFGEPVSDGSSGQVNSEDGVGKSISLIDGDGVGDTITRVDDDTGGSSGGIEGEHGLDGDVEGGDVEGLEQDLGHLLSVSLGVLGSLSQESGVLFGSDSQLIEEGMVPDSLHVVPVVNDTVLNGVLKVEDTSLSLSLITDVGLFVVHTDHDAGHLRSANDGGEAASWGIITCNTGFALT